MLWGLKPVEQKAAHGLTAEKLKQPIFLGLLLPGERLESERRLAEKLGVSRVTLREALSVLETEGVIEIRRGAAGGAFVVAEDKLIQRAQMQSSAQHVAALRLAEYREMAEPMAAKLAAIRRLPADQKDISDALAGLRKAATLGEVRQHEAAFHLSVARASGNHILSASIEEAMTSMFLPFPSGAPKKCAKASLVLREPVAQALRMRDENGAFLAMKAALADLRKRLPSSQVA